MATSLQFTRSDFTRALGAAEGGKAFDVLDRADGKKDGVFDAQSFARSAYQRIRNGESIYSVGADVELLNRAESAAKNPAMTRAEDVIAEAVVAAMQGHDLPAGLAAVGASGSAKDPEEVIRSASSEALGRALLGALFDSRQWMSVLESIDMTHYTRSDPPGIVDAWFQGAADGVITVGFEVQKIHQSNGPHGPKKTVHMPLGAETLAAVMAVLAPEAPPEPAKPAPVTFQSRGGRSRG